MNMLCHPKLSLPMRVGVAEDRMWFYFYHWLPIQPWLLFCPYFFPGFSILRGKPSLVLLLSDHLNHLLWPSLRFLYHPQTPGSAKQLAITIMSLSYFFSLARVSPMVGIIDQCLKRINSCEIYQPNMIFI